MYTTERFNLIAIMVSLSIVSIVAIAISVYSDIENQKINVKRYEICIQSATTDQQRNTCNEVNK